MNNWVWQVSLTLFAALVNTFTAAYLFYLGYVGQRRKKYQDELNWMMTQRIIALERESGRASEAVKKH